MKPKLLRYFLSSFTYSVQFIFAGLLLLLVAHNQAVACYVSTSSTLFLDSMQVDKVSRYLVDGPPTLTNFSANPDPLCVGKQVTFNASVGNVTGSYTYTLTNGSSTTTGTSSNTEFSQPITTTESGVQPFTLIVSSDGQSAMEVYELTVNPPPTITLTASDGGVLSCGQKSLTLTAEGADDYRFSGPNILSQDPENGIAVVGASGIYSVTVTNSETGCFSTTTTTVSSVSTASLIINPSSTILTNASPAVSLTAVGTGTYLWSTGATTQVISVTASGIYSVTLIGPGGCTASASVPVAGADLSIFLDLPKANFAASGTATVGNFVVHVFEVAGLPTSSGDVKITVTAPIGYTIAFAPEQTSINVSGGTSNPVAVNNPQWTVTNSLADRQLMLRMNSGAFISGGGESRLGFILTRTTANSGSTANITVNVRDDLTMSYDANLLNNIYARVIVGL